jgi:hypothetical protein
MKKKSPHLDQTNSLDALVCAMDARKIAREILSNAAESMEKRLRIDEQRVANEDLNFYAAFFSSVLMSWALMYMCKDDRFLFMPFICIVPICMLVFMIPRKDALEVCKKDHHYLKQLISSLE